MEAAASTYARIIFPDVVSKTEPRLSDLQKAMLDATPDCIKVVSVDGKLLTMNRAGCLALNVPETSAFGMSWLPLLPEEVHPLGRAALQKAVAGHNARFPGKSESPNGIRYWDNLLTPIIDASGQVLSILCVSRDVTEKTKLERELEDAISREKLLSRELQHRVKNLFSVVSGLSFIAEKEASRNGAAETGTKLLREKLMALSRASDITFASSHGTEMDTTQISLASLVNAVLLPYGDRYAATGGHSSIHCDEITNLALFLHELATNSVKYGAFGAAEGSVMIQWSTNGEKLQLTWTESGGPPVSSSPQRQGFGSEMVDRIMQSAGGSIDRIWQEGGLIVHLNLPVLHSTGPED